MIKCLNGDEWKYFLLRWGRSWGQAVGIETQALNVCSMLLRAWLRNGHESGLSREGLGEERVWPPHPHLHLVVMLHFGTLDYKATEWPISEGDRDGGKERQSYPEEQNIRKATLTESELDTVEKSPDSAGTPLLIPHPNSQNVLRSTPPPSRKVCALHPSPIPECPCPPPLPPANALQ